MLIAIASLFIANLCAALGDTDATLSWNEGNLRNVLGASIGKEAETACDFLEIDWSILKASWGKHEEEEGEGNEGWVEEDTLRILKNRERPIMIRNF